MLNKMKQDILKLYFFAIYTQKAEVPILHLQPLA